MVRPLMVLLFASIIFYTCALVFDCYPSGDPSHGKGNYANTPASKAMWWSLLIGALPLAAMVAVFRSLHCCKG